MNLKGILLLASLLAAAAALLTASLERPHKTHVASAQGGVGPHTNDSGEDAGCGPSPSPGGKE